MTSAKVLEKELRFLVMFQADLVTSDLGAPSRRDGGSRGKMERCDCAAWRSGGAGGCINGILGGMKQDVFHVVVFDPRRLGGGVTGGVEVKV